VLIPVAAIGRYGKLSMMQIKVLLQVRVLRRSTYCQAPGRRTQNRSMTA
jgi:hypothetical protein